MRAKLFKNGRSQAVRLPKEFRFDGTEVEIERNGDVVILRPLNPKHTDEFWSCFGELDGDFERPPQGSEDKRDEL